MFEFGKKTYIMGIINVTPDSFYDGGKFSTTELAVRRAEALVKEGADILDIGGESTRPGALPVSPEEEISRVIPVIEKVKGFGIPISIDTSKAIVAEEAVRAGAVIINDISGLNFDPEMVKVAARTGAYIVIMHLKGEPRTMQVNPTYNNLLAEVTAYFEKSISLAKENNISPEKIILDPGIGFGKSLEHNLELLRNLGRIKKLGFPVLLGTSRKSFISKISGVAPGERLEGSLASIVAGIANGADIVRVHDVKETWRAVQVADAIYRNR
jgi:dihydropteroate synthase